MNDVDRYIIQVVNQLFASPEESRRFAADLEAHFAAGLDRNESPSQVIERMGTPEAVAAAFNADRPLRYAGFWRRVIAFLGDIGVLICLALPALGFLLWICPTEQAEITFSAWQIGGLSLFALGVAGTMLFYFPVLEARFGKTVGKHLLRLRVLQESAAPITTGQAFLRRLSYYFDLLAPDALFIPFTPKRQRAMDIVARTVVVLEPGDTATWWRYVLCFLLVAAPLALFGLAALVLRGA